MKQHVTNADQCIQCSACEMACPQKAIENIAGRFCIDAHRCKDCGKCITECPTGAADCFIAVESPYSLVDQASWDTMPMPVLSKADCK